MWTIATTFALLAVGEGSPIHLASHPTRFMAGLPDSFDTRTAWFGCGHQVYNQGGCGNCWAVSAVTTLNDRYCIHKGADGAPLDASEGSAGDKNRLFQDIGYCVRSKEESPSAAPGKCSKKAHVLSPQTLGSCMTVTEIKDESYGYKIISRGCQGGEAHEAWAFFHKTGIPTMSPDGASGCIPYLSGICGLDVNANGCHSCNAFSECADTGKAPVTFKVAEWGWIHDDELMLGGYRTGKQNKAALKRQEAMMMQEVMTNGPIHACFDYYENFQDFFDHNPLGVYNSTDDSKYGGGHCVTITGWGTDSASGLPYWLIRNSWSAAWGVHGYYRFLRGAGLSGLEEMEVFAGCPDGTKCRLTEGVRPYPKNHSWIVTPTPRNGAGGTSGGGKWVMHDSEDERAHQLAHAAAVSKGLEDGANGEGRYSLKAFETRVTSRLEARVTMASQTANGEDDEHVAHFHYIGGGQYALVDN